MDGILLVDKPSGKTSHDVVDTERRRLGTMKIGHAGTLDPLATGLLVLGVGRALRLLEFLQGHDKDYLFSVKLGQRTDTDDSSGAPAGEGPVPAREALEIGMRGLCGDIVQRPPDYSAVKVAGRRLYQYARSGREVEAPERRVRVDVFELLLYEPPIARFRVRGSKGLYVRSLARDLGGHVTELRRTASGPFRVEDAGPELLPLETAVQHLPELHLSPEDAQRFGYGITIPGDFPGPDVRVYSGALFIGVGRRTEAGLHPRKVMAGSQGLPGS